MQKGILIRAVVTAATVGLAIHAVFFGSAGLGLFPFSVEPNGSHTLIIRPAQDIPLPPSLHSGDKLDLREQPFATRVAFFIHYTRAHETFTLVVRRDGRALTVPVTRVPGATTSDLRGRLLSGLWITLLLTLGLITLWWGRDWAAWGLSLYGLSLAVNASLFIALPVLVGLAVRLINWTLIFPLVRIGLYVTALAVIGDTLTPAVKKIFHGIFTAMMGARIVLIDLPLVAFVAYGQRNFGGDIGMYLGLAVLIIPLIALALAYASADSRRRSRIGWLFWAMLLLVGVNAWHLVTGIGNGYGNTGWLLITVYWLAAIAAVTGLLYVTLRRQVIALSFVVNRAVVYSLTAGFIVGIFTLLEAVLSNTGIGRSAGLAVNVAVSLAIGLGLDTIHKRIETAIERLLFRRQYTAERTLREFAHRCVFMERPDRLLNEATTQIQTQMQPGGIAIYDRVGDTYRRVRECGARSFPSEVDVDDHAFVALRAGSKRIDLHEADSALGGEGHAFPMAVRGILQGAIVCGGRGERYTPDELELLAMVAHEVGVAWHALQARDSEALLEALANGLVEPAMARERARAMFT